MTATVTDLHPAAAPALFGVGTSEMLARAGISYRQLDYWTRAGYLRIIGSGHPGSGCPRRFTEAEVRIARCAKSLIDCGFGAVAALTHARQLIEGGQPLALGDGAVVLAIVDEPAGGSE